MSADERLRAFFIIAVDPGLVCGVAALTVAHGVDVDGGIAVTMSTDERPWLGAVAYVEEWLKATPPQRLMVVSERFDIPTSRRVFSSQPEALKTNGALEYISTRRGVTFGLQPRAEVKKVVSDALLRRLGWFRKTKDGHANDSARHAGFALFESRPELWLRLNGR